MSALSPAWVTETLFASTLLIAAVLVLRRPAARLLGPQAAYLLWAVPALRLLLPPIPGAAPVSVPLIQAPAFAPQAVQALPASDTAVEAVPALHQAAAFAPSFDWGLALLVLWLAGAALHMIWHVVRYRRFISGAVGAHAPEHVVDGIQVHSADIAGPAAAGIVTRRILLPYDFADRFDRRERRLALAHEVAHHRRGDLIANWVGLAVLSLHWFNPLAHIAYRAFRADQELACDATVLGAASERERHAYASAVVKAAWARSPVAACPMNSAGQLKTRLAMMKAGGIQRPLASLVAVAVVAAAALGVTASRTAAALPELEAASVAVAALERTAGSVPSPFVDERRPASADRQAAPVAELDEAGPAALAASAGSSEGGRALAAQALQFAVAEDRSEPLAVNAAEARIEPAVPAISLVQAVTLPSDGDRPPVAATHASVAAFPPSNVLMTHVSAARKELEGGLSRRVLAAANVHAVMVDGRFNAANPGVPFVGFCGEALFDGQTRWLPFFVSATASKPGRSAKCAGPQSAEDYSSYFRSPPRLSADRRASRGACTADKSACTAPFAGLTQFGHPSATEFLYGTGTYSSTYSR